jgi:hypothetical protein
MKKQKDNDKNSKGGGNGSGNSYVKSSNIVERSKPSGKGTISIGFGKDITTFKDPSDKYSYPSNTSSKSGYGSISGGEGLGSQSGGFDHRLHQLHPRDAETFIERIKASESEIQKLVNQYRPLNPKSNEESLRVCAIITLGIATDKELEGLKNYKIEQSKNIPSDLIPYFASHSGKVIGWLEHQNNTLNLNFNIAGKDLDMSNKQITDENMLFFCQKMTSFTFHFDNLIISNNLMTNLSVQYLFNATLTSPTNRTIKNLDLRNNQIGDVGAELIAAYLKHGYMPATTHVNLADNIITDKGTLCFAESLNSSVNKLKVLHLEGNKLTPDGEFRIGSSIKTVIQDMIVFVKKFTGKEIIKPALKEFIKYAEKYGVDTTHIATNKPTLDYIKDTGIIIKNIAFGYAKCSNIVIDMLTFDTTLPSLAKSTTIEMYGSKAVKKADLKVCVTWETHDAIVSPEGVDLAVKAIDLLGDGE